MKLTWTFYPKYEPRITLSVVYVPEIDKTEKWGFLHVESNQAWVCWECFKVFDRGDIKAKKDAFSRLIRNEFMNGDGIDIKELSKAL
jgi:23S rRNA C2498 (ribose-2'-O)-methylase RlmM